jgi:hypothetical protein
MGRNQAMTPRKRPILFSAPMVRALLDGSKTQTRRVVKPQPAHDQIMPREWSKVTRHNPNAIYGDGLGWVATDKSGNPHEFRCPYGQPGDQLWVRESFAPRTLGAWPILETAMQPIYRADGDRPEWKNIWKPSIHMPRWASRITLEITSVRVERLQGISEADAKAEGIKRGANFPGWYRGPLLGDSAGLQQAGGREGKIPTAFPRLAYRSLWEQINGPGSWDANPWVWAVEFKRLEGGVA